jgi:hypothetical protein
MLQVSATEIKAEEEEEEEEEEAHISLQVPFVT